MVKLLFFFNEMSQRFNPFLFSFVMMVLECRLRQVGGGGLFPQNCVSIYEFCFFLAKFRSLQCFLSRNFQFDRQCSPQLNLPIRYLVLITHLYASSSNKDAIEILDGVEVGEIVRFG